MSRQPQNSAPFPKIHSAIDRRDFLKWSGAAGIAAWNLWSPGRLTAAAPAPNAADLIEGKSAALQVLTETPLVIETPLELLGQSQITPKQLLFVRNHLELPGSRTLKPLSASDWKIELTGLIDRPQILTAETLSQWAQTSHEMVVQCSGNSRSLFSLAAPTKGTQWGRGGMGNVRFTGVPLVTVLEKLGVQVAPQAKFVAAEGRDQPKAGQADFEHSLPLDEVLRKSMLALQMNDEPIPAIHGGPVRLVTPGYFGTMHVKWLSRLRFERDESDNPSQMPSYRMPLTRLKPGATFDYSFQNSRPSWRMNVKSVVFAPLPRAKVPAGKLRVRGVAFNDGEARIESVLISTDLGQTWRQARLERPESVYAWSRWEAEVAFEPGAHQIWSRAIDALGRTQPLDGAIDWNPPGYEWNGVEKIEITIV